MWREADGRDYVDSQYRGALAAEGFVSGREKVDDFTYRSSDLLLSNVDVKSYEPEYLHCYSAA